jgi:hypothetical protein
VSKLCFVGQGARLGRAGHTTRLCDSHPFQRHQPADVVGKVCRPILAFARAMPIVRTIRPPGEFC